MREKHEIRGCIRTGLWGKEILWVHKHGRNPRAGYGNENRQHMNMGRSREAVCLLTVRRRLRLTLAVGMGCGEMDEIEDGMRVTSGVLAVQDEEMRDWEREERDKEAYRDNSQSVV